MSRRILMLILAGILIGVVAGGLGYRLGLRRPHATPMTGPVENPAASNKTAGNVLYWHDPMVPGSRFDKPGKSPFMDMQLVPVYVDEAADQGKVSVSPRVVQSLGMRIVEVAQGTVDLGFETVGAVSVDERSMTAVQSRVSGYVEKLHVRAQYDSVMRGQPLVDIYAPEWLSAEEEYLALKRATQPGAETLAQAARERLALLGIPEQQIQRLEQSGETSGRITLRAPESGVVWELGTREGSAVSPGMTLFKLASLGTVWVNAEVPETQAALVAPGISVEARAAAYPDQVFKGRVTQFLPDVNAVTRTIKARIELSNPGGLLKPGMFTRLAFAAHSTSGLMVPAEAVIYTGRRTVVIVAEGDGKFRPVDVKVGRDSGDMTEIRKGLERGQKVVASGQFLIDSESSLRSALARMNDPAGAAQPQGAASGERK